MALGKLLVVVGVVIVALGVVLMMGLPLGRLPGDIVYRRGGSTVYIPLATSILLSVVLTLVLMWLRR